MFETDIIRGGGVLVHNNFQKNAEAIGIVSPIASLFLDWLRSLPTFVFKLHIFLALFYTCRQCRQADHCSKTTSCALEITKGLEHTVKTLYVFLLASCPQFP